MFKTVNEFEKAKNDVIKLIHEKNSEFRAHIELDDIDLHDILDHLISEKLILGVVVSLDDSGKLILTENHPRLSYDGLIFREEETGKSWAL